MKFVFGTVIYPEGLIFLADFLKSLCDQTDREYHLLLVNDGCNLSGIQFDGIECTIIPGERSITRNREILIDAASKGNYEWIIFGDADDIFENNRIQIIREYSCEYDLISNEIIPVNGITKSEPQFQKELGDFSEINVSFIRDKNLFGFSNVACKIDFIKNRPIPSEIIAVDWFLFSKAMQAGAKACFTSRTNTYYRQWSNNIIGINQENKKKIKTGIKAKYFHYKNMLSVDSWFGNEIPWLKNLYYQSDNQNFELYYNKLKQQHKEFLFWWENIKNY